MSGPGIAGAHSRAASDYRWRIGYLTPMFDRLAAVLPLTPDSEVLDLCCGSGQLAEGLAPHVGAVVGIDAAEGMLALAPALARATWLHHDVNGPLPEALAQRRFDHLFLGRAIPYVGDEALRLYTDRLANEGCVVVCGAGLLPSTAWAADFLRLRGRYAPVRGDFIGGARLAACGFELDERVSVRASLACDGRFLLRHALSFALSREAIRADLPAFRARLAAIVSEHAQGGRLRGEVLSWALVFRRRPHLRTSRARAAHLLRSGAYPL